MKILEAEHLCKSFGQTKVLKDISFFEILNKKFIEKMR